LVPSVKTKDISKIAQRNLSLFICFRMLFNARFYYPVYALIFLEHGLSWEDFGILNAIWALTIIILEVPSGALADTLGRKKLLVLAAICMVVEMVALLFAPMNGSEYVFLLFALNRIVSGLAEAAASGADEALAYDSLKEAGLEKNWGKALEKAQRFTSLAFFFAMMTGSAFYDSSFINSCLNGLGINFSITAETAVKAPIFLTFISSLVVLGAALGMKDPFEAEKMGAWETMKLSFRKTVEAGSWIWKTPLPFGILLAAMALDNVIRQFLTIASAYWNVIELPLATFGLVASGMSLMGVFIPRLARLLADRFSPNQNFFLLCPLLFVGLYGISYAFPYWGIVPAILLYATMQIMNYLVSRYLNEEASSDRRATVLSFRGLSTNLSYGAVSILYSGLIAWIKTEGIPAQVMGRKMNEQDAVFVQSLGWFPWYFIITLILVVIFYRLRFRKN
jgi:MFS family permease